MFHYIVILLDDTSTSFCHCDNPYRVPNLIPLETLKKAFLFAMKNNLNIQLVYPNYDLPEEYKKIIYEVEHTNIVSSDLTGDADVVVLNSLKSKLSDNPDNLIIRDTFNNIVTSYDLIESLLRPERNVSIVITDIQSIKESDLSRYEALLSRIEALITPTILNGTTVKLSNITDRLTLAKMNNCNAGWRSITLAPNGNFYICPSFFYSNENDIVGNINTGIEIKNANLYNIKYAPICSICDCYQCKRCIWLNKYLTLEVNTPSHQQCVLAHYERNVAKKLLDDIRLSGEYLNGIEINEIEYLDPLEKIIK